MLNYKRVYLKFSKFKSQETVTWLATWVRTNFNHTPNITRSSCSLDRGRVVRYTVTAFLLLTNGATSKEVNMRFVGWEPDKNRPRPRLKLRRSKLAFSTTKFCHL
jgi:hypothetical protein